MSLEQEENGEEAVDDVEEQPAVETDTEGEEEPQEGEAESDEEDKPEEEGDDETVVSLGEEPEPVAEQESSTLREVRKRLREQEREAKAAKAELERLKAPAKPQLGKKPTPDDFDYDNDKYAEAMESWVKQKAVVEAEAKEGERAQAKQAEEWQASVSRYRERKAELSTKVPDFADAEETVASVLSVAQQSAIMAYAEQPEALIYALGRSEKKLSELAGTKDILKFVATIAKLEAKDLTVTTAKKQPPPPARKTGGTNAPATAVSKTTDRLLADAEKSGGNLTNMVDHLRKQKQKEK